MEEWKNGCVDERVNERVEERVGDHRASDDVTTRTLVRSRYFQTISTRPSMFHSWKDDTGQ
jgi:hypothetical protein